MAAKKEPQVDPQPAAAAEPAAQSQVLLRLDERNMRASYANAFRTNVTPEEVMLDFGLNVVSGTAAQGRQPEMTFQLGERIILNPFTAKRLAIMLGQLIRQHEQQFGEVELDAGKRRKS
jgi:Protein of unknown function (DUF3467)